MPDDLTLLRPRNAKTILHESTQDADTDEDGHQPFSFGRVGTRPQMTLTIQQASGRVKVFPYGQFDGAESHNPDEGFTVKFGRELITIEGQNLSRLFQYICNFRASEIIEATPQGVMQLGSEDPVVWKVKVSDGATKTAAIPGG